MEYSYWIERWKQRHIGFDQPSPNLLLQAHFEKLELSEGSTVFVPLTGKSIDVVWLLSKGFHVIGCELSELAVRELFEQLKLKPKIVDWKYGKVYSKGSITIFVGDFFELRPNDIGRIDGVYDRASMVALPPEMRKEYSRHLQAITKYAPQLLIVFEYDQSQLPGPPFSISEKELLGHYGTNYTISLVEQKNLKGGLKGSIPATENAWLLIV